MTIHKKSVTQLSVLGLAQTQLKLRDLLKEASETSE